MKLWQKRMTSLSDDDANSRLGGPPRELGDTYGGDDACSTDVYRSTASGDLIDR